MEKFIINGGKKLTGAVSVSGAKNVALKALVAACLTEEKLIIHNIPLISDFFVMVDIIKELGGEVSIKDHTATVQLKRFKKDKISLDKAAEIRTSSMFLAPLLARTGGAIIPNPGGCRIGARPIDRIIKGLREMGVDIVYNNSDGYFHASTKQLEGTKYRFEKNSHTGTETLILAGVLAKGRTILENAAQEPEVDELISLLNLMGAKIKRVGPRTIVINGVENLCGVEFSISPDRNEIVTFAIAAIITEGDIFIKDIKTQNLRTFLAKLKAAGAGFEEKNGGLRFYYIGNLTKTDIVTSAYPGFMTDWQGPWAVLMAKANGTSTIHETVYENRFGYVSELKKMGAKITFFNPQIKNRKEVYNFNLEDDTGKYFHGAKIYGSTPLHNGVLTISDLRAGATLVLAALAARGQSIIFGVEHLDRGYENFDKRLRHLGADIKRVDHE
ncbi:MAG: UDP-N-acetylglucosamine 1-carboxyvinyltransferase [Candidatus Levybacteria bacterium]|nr:UDP-N-acetylglucosamine 1-carboxyvinyltransferase [Candidatus Levybacteria bacterium]